MVPGEKAKIAEFQNILKAAIKRGQTLSPKFLALELEANRQFMSMINQIQHIIADSRYISVPVHPSQRPEIIPGADTSPPKKKHKRKNRSGGSQDLGSVTPSLQALPRGASRLASGPLPVSGPPGVQTVVEHPPVSLDDPAPTHGPSQSPEPPSTAMAAGQPMQ
ncbi:hypothetical protein FRC08_014002, partial [Ceratobasidium sp. 394]